MSSDQPRTSGKCIRPHRPTHRQPRLWLASVSAGLTVPKSLRLHRQDARSLGPLVDLKQIRICLSCQRFCNRHDLRDICLHQADSKSDFWDVGVADDLSFPAGQTGWQSPPLQFCRRQHHHGSQNLPSAPNALQFWQGFLLYCCCLAAEKFGLVSHGALLPCRAVHFE